VPRLRYLDEVDIHGLIEEMTLRVFPGTLAFRLNGADGAQRLSAALAQPRWAQYGTLQSKAAVLLYHLIMDHPYIDGNKRLAVVATETFLVLNDARLLATDDEVANLALAVADHRVDRAGCYRFVRARCPRWSWSEDRTKRWLLSCNEDELAELGEVLGRGAARRRTSRLAASAVVPRRSLIRRRGRCCRRLESSSKTSQRRPSRSSTRVIAEFHRQTSDKFGTALSARSSRARWPSLR
jgi:death-on-curing protein